MTVITVAMDRNSMFPLVFHIRKACLYSTMNRSVYTGMMQISATSALGMMQIMVGVFNIGLGPGRMSRYPGDFSDLRAAYWLGGVFLVSGLSTFAAGRISTFYWMVFAVFLNILAFAFSIIGIVIYSVDLSRTISANYCGGGQSNCSYVENFFKRLVVGMDISMIVQSVVQLSASISFAVLGIKALIITEREEEIQEDPGQQIDLFQPKLKVHCIKVENFSNI
ncbi:uncharacterized protein LOC121514067 isoform X2 [Cheilinus undulatus]|uniref:uncharacterized protein LOC121514067 isoform X2 n=1 Tax=Cheilinus undulatus TaxID=241271 RepID=UPI001BD58BA1|nr:uncharacterized protein LOC121514067 isoform X2 [Cheilinus undulatus]